MSKLLGILWVALFVQFGVAQEVATDSILIEDVSSTLNERSLEDLAKKYDGQQFDYDIKTGESQNLLDRFFTWLRLGLRKTFGIDLPPWAFDLIRILVYAIMGVLILYLIIRLFLNERVSAIFTKKATAIDDFDFAESHIEQINLKELLQNALKENNFRLAVRYHFLNVLKMLSERDFIDWHYEKTNTDYLKELHNKTLKNGFEELAYLYDYVWYGEQPINEPKYQQARKKFMNMENAIIG